MASNRSLARRPVWTLQYNISTGNITTSAWQQVLASIPYACTSLEIFCSGGSIMQFSIGTPGNELKGILPYTILPGGSSIFLPFETSPDKLVPGSLPNGLRKGLPLTCKAVDQSSTAGYLIINAFA